MYTKCGDTCVHFSSSENRNTVLNCGKERTTHANERNSEPKIKLIVDLELFLAICALMRMLGESGIFMCEKLQNNHVFSKKACRSYAASFASNQTRGRFYIPEFTRTGSN